VPGAFIVVEGPDGVGKTTLVRGLSARFRGAEVPLETVREPGGTPVAEIARKAAFDLQLEASPLAELFLILAARADLVAKVIRPALLAGKVVLSDRYDFSTMAYQVAGRGLPRDAVVRANELATGGLRPDVTIVLDAPADVGRQRQVAQAKRQDRMEREEPSLHERVAAWFRALEGPDIVHLDATGRADEVEAVAWEALCSRLGETFPQMTG
jgi:dTMP kinase